MFWPSTLPQGAFEGAPTTGVRGRHEGGGQQGGRTSGGQPGGVGLKGVKEGGVGLQGGKTTGGQHDYIVKRGKATQAISLSILSSEVTSNMNDTKV